MKLAQYNVYDLAVFDTEENLIVDFNTMRDVEVFFDEKEDTYFVVARDALLNTDFLKFIGESKKQTDLEKYLGKSNKIKIKRRSTKKCKLVAKTVMLNPDSNKDVKVTLEFPLVETDTTLSLRGNTEIVSEFDVVFKVIPIDDEYFEIHI